MHACVRDLRTLMLQHANPRDAVPMRRYMGDRFEFLGLKRPAVTSLVRQHLRTHGLPALPDLDSILRGLWALPPREFQYAALEILSRFEQRLPASFIRTLHHLLVTRSWWDTVDPISTGPLAIHFKRFPLVRDRTLARWRISSNLWLRRACLLFQLNYKSDTDFALMQAIIRENLGSDEFFINKAIGWALRQYSRTDPAGVRRVVARTPLHPLSAREALKWLQKHPSS